MLLIFSSRVYRWQHAGNDQNFRCAYREDGRSNSGLAILCARHLFVAAGRGDAVQNTFDVRLRHGDLSGLPLA
jgi:hypothetical protein